MNKQATLLAVILTVGLWAGVEAGQSPETAGPVTRTKFIEPVST